MASSSKGVESFSASFSGPVATPMVPGQDQADFLKSFQSPMMQEKLKNDEDNEVAVDEVEESHPDISSLMIKDPEEIQSIHSRMKLKHDESVSQIERGMKDNALSIDSHMASILSRRIKGATLLPTELEVMALTIKACQEEYALNEIRNSLSNITSMMKNLTAEVDDATRRSKNMSQSLNENVEMINKFKESLQKTEQVQTVHTVIPPPVSQTEKATQMISGSIDLATAQKIGLIGKFERYIGIRLPQMSVESFKALPKETRTAHFQAAMDGSY